ncbi:LamG domain-containing protein [Sorangium sp. So ce1151]|uniref:LamG domain-containing protein n=1 Tax=Sorangium sp. So ce1151 TaxID=3133332 RepID=UPI003F61C057
MSDAGRARRSNRQAGRQPDSFLLGIDNGQYFFSVAFPDGGAGRHEIVHAPAVANAWAHVTGVYDGAALKLYVNGVLSASTPTSGTLQQSTRPIVIGGHPSWNAYNGLIDEVRLYQQALSAAQVAQLAAGEVYPVRAYYVYPHDQPYHQEYVDAINTYLDERCAAGTGRSRAPRSTWWASFRRCARPRTT